MTSNAFLAAVRRFIARRGKPKTIFSDNGTNFVGANRQITELYKLLVQNKDHLNGIFAIEKINWNFIPPHTPHFGGMWEAGIKSVKQHLKRVTSGASLTFEEFSTVLTQIESILNSRPLTQLSSDPHDFQVLTPAHFLIGRPYTLAADQDVTDTNVTRLDRLQYLQKIVQHFWKRWSREYLTSLQQRKKWRQQTPNIKIGSLVLIKEDNFPPSKWQLGRVCRCYPGTDNQVRVVDVKCASGIIKRPVVKLCPLPVEDRATIFGPSEQVVESEGSKPSTLLKED